MLVLTKYLYNARLAFDTLSICILNWWDGNIPDILNMQWHFRYLGKSTKKGNNADIIPFRDRHIGYCFFSNHVKDKFLIQMDNNVFKLPCENIKKKNNRNIRDYCVAEKLHRRVIIHNIIFHTAVLQDLPENCSSKVKFHWLIIYLSKRMQANEKLTLQYSLHRY